MRLSRHCMLVLAGLCLLVGLIVPLGAQNADQAGAKTYRSPYDLRFSPDGKMLAVSDRTAGALVLIDPASGKITREVPVAKTLGAVAWSADSSKVYVADFEGASVAEVNAADAKVARRIAVSPYPNGLALAQKKQLLLVTGTGLSELSIVDLTAGKEKSRVKMLREPFAVAITPDESLAVVSNLLPAMAASDPQTTSAVSLVELDSGTKVADIKLPPNTTCIRQVSISPDGRFAYTVHTIGRTTLPATQLERGWVNTNAISVIDLKARELVATMLMDTLSLGAADPWGITVAADGATAWVSLSGVHQVATLDLARIHQQLDSSTSSATRPAAGRPAAVEPYIAGTIWAQMRTDPKKRAELVNDLSALYAAGMARRVSLPAKGPRGIDISPDGKQLAVAMYYGAQVLLLDPGTSKPLLTANIGPKQELTDIRRGELIFHDASYAFQQWLSCATCHPNEARIDGMNWDLLNDGIGNPKNAKSLLRAHMTPPSMWLGVREDMATATAAGFRFASYQPAPEDVKAVQLYLASLTPLRSPYRKADGQLSEKATKGKQIFEDARTACAQCHSGPDFTDGKQHNVGTQGPLDHKEHDTFDTPTLLELWRTGPFLHDGQAVTLEDVLTKFNTKDQHGKTSHLNKEQVEALVEYLLSL